MKLWFGQAVVNNHSPYCKNLTLLQNLFTLQMWCRTGVEELSHKEPEVKYFKFRGQIVSATTIRFCHYNTKAARENLYVNECDWETIKLYLQNTGVDQNSPECLTSGQNECFMSNCYMSQWTLSLAKPFLFYYPLMSLSPFAVVKIK